MKKLFILMAAMFMVAACGKGGNDGPTDDDGDVIGGGLLKINAYVGTVEVTQEDGTVFKRENVRSRFDFDSAAGTMSMTLYEVSFAPNMPVTIDMVADGLLFGRKDDKVQILGDGIVPSLASGTLFPMYTITGFNGTITSSDVEFSAKFGTFPVKYSASRAN